MTVNPNRNTRAVHRRTFVSDAHNDLLMSVVLRPPAEWGETFRSKWLPKLRAGNVKLQVLPVCVDPMLPPEGALRRTLLMIEAAHRIAADNPDSVALCCTSADLRAARADGRIGLVLALEGCAAVGEDTVLLGLAHRLGVRVAALVHYRRTLLADGSAEDQAGSRLTRAGVEAISAMEHLGVILDVSHLGRTALDHALELATRPILASHSAARSLRDHHRNLSDEHIRGISETGGMVCVNFFGPFVHEAERSISRVVDHIEHIATVAGVDRVGIGPDFTKDVLLDILPGWEAAQSSPHAEDSEFIAGLESPADLPKVTHELVARGWSERDIHAVMGRNLLRFLEDNLN